MPSRGWGWSGSRPCSRFSSRVWRWECAPLADAKAASVSPTTPLLLPRYGDDVGYYLMVRPGMTGLWQVSGRSDVDYDARVYLDSWYVKNWSLWHDLIILLKTVKVVFKRTGAY